MTTACPACGQTTTLLALGTRWDRPHRWRPWVLTGTDLYLCARCDALVAVRQPRHGSRSGPVMIQEGAVMFALPNRLSLANRPTLSEDAPPDPTSLTSVPHAVLLWLTLGVAEAVLFTMTDLIEEAIRPGYNGW